MSDDPSDTSITSLVIPGICFVTFHLFLFFVFAFCLINLFSPLFFFFLNPRVSDLTSVIHQHEHEKTSRFPRASKNEHRGNRAQQRRQSSPRKIYAIISPDVLLAVFVMETDGKLNEQQGCWGGGGGGRQRVIHTCSTEDRAANGVDTRGG